ncbi:hypothetical protein IMG5_045930 [Ichthyophthirius multifiliis]|uniref:Phosphodiesterase n=1 Tax=Ichthyophthirius multifiliis TaxID=5932 RepID=G0QM75_ICHMU|nr:hypothetical protein IMG5_045930 [Ichthyophthirius multifiliis]EGR33678.1 hypothetical protein IMG5_045930 [Ichthyophthirius multifiliis]|eukprot:XP_004037664.1 hypothetical protein IMG5_045930 [Ichthyophthirius multifiliis]
MYINKLLYLIQECIYIKINIEKLINKKIFQKQKEIGNNQTQQLQKIIRNKKQIKKQFKQNHYLFIQQFQKNIYKDRFKIIIIDLIAIRFYKQIRQFSIQKKANKYQIYIYLYICLVYLNIQKQSVISVCRRKIKNAMKSKFIQYLVVLLIFLYTTLIFTNIALDDLIEDKDKSSQITKQLHYIELIILSIFFIEIILNSYSSGLKHYFSNKSLFLDFLIIIISIILVIIDISTSNNSFSSVATIIRGIFRFLRIFLLIRKFQTFKKIKVSSTINTPAERILEIMSEFKEYFDSINIIQDIQWTMDIIASNKLFDPLMLDENNNEQVIEWVNFGKVQTNSQEKQIQLRNEEVKLNVNQQAKYLVLKRQIPVNVLNEFQKIDELYFDCFKLEQISKGDETSYLLIYLFIKYDLIQELQVELSSFKQFALSIQNGYNNNPYHYKLHAFDVLQTLHFFMRKCNFCDLSKTTKLEQIAMYIAAAAHDYDHPGYNNVFLINTNNILALRYNDLSVLENYHTSCLFSLILNNKQNIFIHLKNDEFKQFRELVISMILATDMSKHFTDISKLKSRLSSQDFEIDNKDKKICMENLLHASDVSNPIKEWKTCFQWTSKVMMEFWNQGDQEKLLRLPVSYLCDKYTTNVSKSQHGFIDFVVKPLYEVVVVFLPELQFYLINLEKNRQKWTELLPKYDQELSIVQILYIFLYLIIIQINQLKIMKKIKIEYIITNKQFNILLYI